MKVHVITTVCLLVASCAWAAPSVHDNQIESETTFTRAARYLGSCFENDDMTTCLAAKGIAALNRAARSNSIEFINGVTFKRDPANPVQRTGRALSESDVLSQLPKNTEERNSKLIDMAVESATDLLGSHNLEVKVPAEATQELGRALDEGRAKLKKMMGPIGLIVALKLFALLPLFLGGLALLTTKAIIVAKIAFFLAILVGGSRIFGGFGNKAALGGGYSANTGWSGAPNGGWSSGAASAYPYARSIKATDEAQELAYAGQVNAQ